MLIVIPTLCCNNHCHFCMVSDYLSDAQRHRPLEELKSEISKLKPGEFVYLYGGEPTLYPDIIRLLEFISSRDLLCSIATNCRLFSSKDFARRISSIGVWDIRTSLHGADAQTHDSITRVKGSFDESCQGIANLTDVGVPVIVNVVLTTANLSELEKTARLLGELHVSQIKLSMLINTKSNIHLAPKLNEIRERLKKLLPMLERIGLEVIIEKAPLCVAPKYLQKFNYEQGLLRYCMGIEPVRTFGREELCGNCILLSACYGLDPEYFEVYGDSELLPISQVDPDSITVLEFGDLKSYEPKMYRTNVIAFMDEEKPDTLQLVKQFERIAKEARKFLAGVYLLPYECVKQKVF